MKDLVRKIPAGGMFLFDSTSPEDVFIPEEFTREHKDVLSAVEEFIRGEILSRGEEIETLNYELSRELMRKCGELGFLGIDIPEKYGGTELDKVSSAIVSERFGYGAGSFGLTELNSTGIGMLPVALFGTEEQKKKYLPGLSAGKLIGAFALTEPEAGSDALNSLTTATLTEDGRTYLLNGNKQFITNAGFADIVFTYGKVDGKHFTAFILEQNWDGISTDEEEQKMGFHGTSTRAYHFDNVRVPVENVLGEVGKGHLVALNALNMGRFKVGTICMGHAKRAFTEAVRYSKQRIQFGRPICEFGLIKEKIAKMAVGVFASESITYRTAGLIQRRLESSDKGAEGAGMGTAEALREYLVECSINKVLGSETEGYVVDEEMQIFGGYGYIHGNHPELAYRHARPNRIWEGTNEINRTVIMNTMLARVTKGPFDLKSAFAQASATVGNPGAATSDEPESLEAQGELLRACKQVFLYLFGLAYQRHGQDLREEQALVGLLSDMIIGIYALDTTLLRSQKLSGTKKSDRSALSLKMTKVLFHESVERMGFLARQLLEALEEGGPLRRDLENVRRLMCPPPINSVALRREIADSMIRYGSYSV
jgi:alkylation response protein AidB-like acyl-CoA dehydrogenase